MDRRRFLAAAGAAGVAATASLSGCLGAQGGSAADYDVGMTATAFAPAEVTVAVGETVVWHNNSSRTHTVTAYEDAIPDEADFFATGDFEDEETARESWWSDRGGALESGEEFSHTFEVAGIYDYVCIPHEQGGMLGTVVVEE